MDATDANLAAQYEAYPYPARDPREEARRLIVGSPGHLREIDHWVFGAARPRAEPLNALFAGGGTGDGTIMLAQQMVRDGRPGRVTWLDRSAAAQAIAQARAQARGLTNIDFHLGALQDLPASGLGPFDYIDCCGVLHHLPDPAGGLASLTAVLAPGGGIGLMVYAPHGRTGVYMVQDALRLLAPPDQPPAARLDVARRVMRHLPASAWLRANRNFGDHIEGGDAGLFDLLLNPRDRAYDIAALFGLVESAGLAVAVLIDPMRYDPAIWLPDPKLRARAAALAPVAQAALAEALTGNMSTHVLYCRRACEPKAAADGDAAEAIPVAREISGPAMAAALRPDGMLPVLVDGQSVPIPLPPLARPLLDLVDGDKTVAAIVATVAARGNSMAATSHAWSSVFRALNRANRLLLRPV